MTTLDLPYLLVPEASGFQLVFSSDFLLFPEILTYVMILEIK